MSSRRKQSNSASLVLGILAIILGVLALIISIVPLIGVISLPLSVVGLLLAFLGLVVAVVKKGGAATPLVGGILNGLAIVVVFVLNGAIIAAGIEQQKLQNEYMPSVTVEEIVFAAVEESNDYDAYFTVSNTGDKALDEVEVKVTYYAENGTQLIVKEDEVLDFSDVPLEAGASRKFDIDSSFGAYNPFDDTPVAEVPVAEVSYIEVVVTDISFE